FGLRGLFGVDCVVRDGVPWPVEVNPRYTASVEVLEHATRRAALGLHRRAFEPAAPRVSSSPRAPGVVGQAGPFARGRLTFPGDGPWTAGLRSLRPADELPAFADIPREGELLEAGRPVLTLFARAETPAACEDVLRRTAADLDRWLF